MPPPLPPPRTDDAPGAGAEVMILPPLPTATLASGDVVTTVWPCALMLVMTAAGASDLVVIVLPWASVVVTGTSTLTDAELSKADVVWTTTLPSAAVEEYTNGTSTPVSVVGAADDPPAPPEPPEMVPCVIAGGVLTMVLPAASVVVIGAGVDAAIVDSATIELTIVLPAALVVVIGTSVAPPSEEPTIGEPCALVVSAAAEVTMVLPAALVVVTGTVVAGPSEEPTIGEPCAFVVSAAAEVTTVLPAALVVVTGTVVAGPSEEPTIGEPCALVEAAEGAGEAATEVSPAALLSGAAVSPAVVLAG